MRKAGWIVWTTFVALSGASASNAPPSGRGPDAGGYIVTGPHAPQVHRAMRKLERLLQLPEACQCTAYLEERGWSRFRRVADDMPLTITTELAFPRPAQAAYAMAQSRKPWTVIHLNPARLGQKLGDCELASILLHELGHLARRDTTDHEPADFFRKCRVRCLKPGRMR
jgi:hypothetical protein